MRFLYCLKDVSMCPEIENSLNLPRRLHELFQNTTYILWVPGLVESESQEKGLECVLNLWCSWWHHLPDGCSFSWVNEMPNVHAVKPDLWLQAMFWSAVSLPHASLMSSSPNTQFFNSFMSLSSPHQTFSERQVYIHLSIQNTFYSLYLTGRVVV